MSDVAFRGEFSSLIDAVAVQPVRTEPAAGSEAREISALGPSVSDDPGAAASVSRLTELGPSVGDDNLPTVVTVLGPSVGDDAIPSDVRLKDDVRCIGSTVFGLPLYRFRYIGRPETYEGVMAHEVLQVMPSAVSVGADGYHRVNYGALGASLRRIS